MCLSKFTELYPKEGEFYTFLKLRKNRCYFWVEKTQVGRGWEKDLLFMSFTQHEDTDFLEMRHSHT